MKKLEDIVEFQNGLWTGKKEPFVSAKILRNTNFKNNDGTLNFDDVAEIQVEKNQFEKRTLAKGDIILERSGGGPTQPVGRVVYFEGEGGRFGFSNFTTRIRTKVDNLNSKYVWFFLHGFYLSGKTENMQKKTTGIRNLTFSEYKQIEVPIPPLSDQKKVVAKLEKLLDKIKEAKRLRAESQEVTDNLLSAELHKIFEGGRKNKSWEEKELGKVCELNPKKSEVKDSSDNLSVSFVPMAAVDEYSQSITDMQARRFGEVRKGYTYFKNDDVLFAKITPCMENGKVAMAKNLENGIGFGTTEFHVLRAGKEVLPEWIYQIIRQPFFREAARERMTGSAGQKRVPIGFLENYKILVPPIGEQKKIVEKLNLLSSKLDKMKKFQDETESELLSLEKSILGKAFSGEF